MTPQTANNYQLSDSYNPIIEATKPLFVLVNAMKNTTSALSVDAILAKYSSMVNTFEETAEKNRASYDAIKAAKYCLCTFIDEMAAKAGWADENWAQKSLLVTFFNETWGGERFFEILDNAKTDPEKNLYLLEFIYVCLQFGYKGKYQVLPNGDLSIDRIKNELLAIINQYRPNSFENLFKKTTTVTETTEKKSKLFVPLWVVAVLTSLLVGILFFILQWLLGGRFNVTSTQVNSITLPKVAPSPNQTTAVKVERLSPLLENEIARKLVEVKDSSDRSVVTIKGDGLFESGSEKIQDQYFPVLATVGQALDTAQGQIVVTGYTDDTPIQSMAFPSNWHLSQARADAVKEILLKYVTNKDRIRSEGRGATNPVVPNDSPENKAKNRRVEITLFTTGDGPKLATSVEKVVSDSAPAVSNAPLSAPATASSAPAKWPDCHNLKNKGTLRTWNEFYIF